MSTLPQLNRQLEDDFVNTWYEIRAQVVDNILESTIFSLALKEFGAMEPQLGGEFGWTDTIGYGQKSTQRFQEGSTVSQSVPQLDTFARLDWRFFCVDVNRSLIDDAKNMGKFQIKSYLTRRLGAARDAIVQDLETYLMQYGAFYDAPLQINGLIDIVAPSSAVTPSGAVAASGTYATGTSNGSISRTNTWWRNWVMADGLTQANANRIAGPTNEPYDLNLVSDMDHFFNSISANAESPNFILSGQLLYEAYVAEMRDRIQIVRTGFNKTAADLGFETVTFRGATYAYTDKITTLRMDMLNMNYIDFNFHPNVWFEMTEWRDTANQFERVSYIVSMSPGLATSQPRRHGTMLYAS